MILIYDKHLSRQASIGYTTAREREAYYHKQIRNCPRYYVEFGIAANEDEHDWLFEIEGSPEENAWPDGALNSLSSVGAGAGRGRLRGAVCHGPGRGSWLLSTDAPGGNQAGFVKWNHRAQMARIGVARGKGPWIRRIERRGRRSILLPVANLVQLTSEARKPLGA
jgi:hypothetical protein